MNNLVWRNIGRLALLLAVQVLILNQVYLGGYVMPMLYVLFVLMLPTGMKRIPLLLTAFGVGLTMDVMNNALGFHSLACTVVAMLRIWFADRILTRGEPVVINRPSIYSVTPQHFIFYLVLMLGAFYLVLYGVELFGSRGLWGVVWASVCSTVATALLAVLYQLVFLKRETT
ncbi:MAG: hypothetical protein IJU19_06170 [Bacteroidales bacterium]|nr:hypothetical protein [Bacteroidales bacterium]